MLEICSAAQRGKTPVKRVTFIWSVKDNCELALRYYSSNA